jgi:hypothetical protein
VGLLALLLVWLGAIALGALWLGRRLLRIRD